jgi:hypothetical protein
MDLKTRLAIATKLASEVVGEYSLCILKRQISICALIYWLFVRRKELVLKSPMRVRYT